MHLDAPRGFHNPDRVAERLVMLKTAPSTQPLRSWADDLAARRRVVVPHFDPAEAGVDARVLMLLEAPGPMANEHGERPGSGFISVDNDDPTAQNIWTTRNDVGLHDGVLVWNIVPWYLGPASIHPTVSVMAQGAMELRRLLPLLQNVSAIVLSGRYAQSGWKKHVAPFVGSALTVFETWHPSALSFNQPGHSDDFKRALERAVRYA